VTAGADRGVAQFFRIDEVPLRALSQPALGDGCSGRLLSHNPRTGQRTLAIETLAGWSAPIGGGEGTLELLILEGSLTVAGSRLGAGGFVAVPTGCAPLPAVCHEAVRGIAIWSPHFAAGDYYDGAPLVVRTVDLPWEPTIFPAELQAPGRLHGVWSKSLRLPDPVHGDVHGGPKGLLRIVVLVGGFVGDHRQESHPGCWEEIIWLAGDFFMPGTGRQAAGSYVGNPPHHRHGPLLTQRGCILLVHTDAPADFCFHEPPIPAALISAYMDGVSWLQAPVHLPLPGGPPWGSDAHSAARMAGLGSEGA
jgi:hypothetical protein